MKLSEFFEGLITHKAAEGNTPKTLQEYRRIIEKVLRPSIADIELEELREIDTDKIKIQGRQHGQFGEQRGIVVFRQLLQYIKKVGLKSPVDWRDIKVPGGPKKEVVALTQDDWKQVREAFDLNWIVGLRDRALVEILWASGLRISEALSLNRDSINWSASNNGTTEVSVRNCKPPYEMEKVYFTEESMYWVRQYLQMRNENCEPLFVTYTGQRATPSGVRRTIHQAMKRAGVDKHVHPHLFRSTFVTNLLQGTEEGGAVTDIKTVQILARHRSERTTLKHYSAVVKGRAKKEHERVLNKPVPKLEVDFVKELMWKRT